MIDFMRYKKLYFVISLLVLIPGIFSLGVWGLNPSIDFAGGSVWEFQVTDDSKDISESANELGEVFTDSGIEVATRSVGSENRMIAFKLPHISAEQRTEVQTKITEQQIAVEEVQFETVGPTLGRELLTKTLFAIFVASVAILFYIAWRFKDRVYGVSAIVAMFHDTIVILGIFSLLGHFFDVEVDSLFVTALLTILSFSVHDTIVVYDRIRESVRKYPKDDYITLVNRAVGETLVRSLNNSLTIVFMLLALLLMGGETVRWFVLALLIGTISGTYSSTFTAAPMLVVWHSRRRGKNKKK